MKRRTYQPRTNEPTVITTVTLPMSIRQELRRIATLNGTTTSALIAACAGEVILRHKQLTHAGISKS